MKFARRQAIPFAASVSGMFSAWDVGGEIDQAVDVPDTLIDRLGYVTLSG